MVEKKFKLGDIIAHVNYKALVTSVEKDFYRVRGIEGLGDGKSGRTYYPEFYRKVGNIFEKEGEDYGKRETD